MSMSMSGFSLVSAVAGVLATVVMSPLGPATPLPGREAVSPASLTPIRGPAFVACPLAAVPSTTAVPAPPAPPPARDRSRPTVGGDALDTPGLTVPAGAPPLPTTLNATSWLVADLDSGAVLGACGPHEYGTPASVQKLLLAATLLDKLDPAQVVTVTREDLDFERGSSAVGLLLDGRYTVETLWLGLLLVSGNDAANVLARVGGGTDGVAGTMTAMNDLARRLGASETHAVTPHGLDGAGQFTSAYDLALISRVCFARADFRRYTTTLHAQVPARPPKDPRGFQIQNHNQLLTQYPGAIGGKTGFTEIARHTYVGAAERGGRRLVVTMLGAQVQPVRAWQQAAGLLDWGFAVSPDARVGHLVTPDEVARAATASPSNVAAPVNRPATKSGDLTTAGLAAILFTVFTGVPLLLMLTRDRRRENVGGAL